MQAGGTACLDACRIALLASFNSSSLPLYSTSSVFTRNASAPTLVRSSANFPAFSKSTMFRLSGTVGDVRFISIMTLIFSAPSGVVAGFLIEFVILYLQYVPMPVPVNVKRPLHCYLKISSPTFLPMPSSSFSEIMDRPGLHAFGVSSLLLPFFFRPCVPGKQPD